MGAVSVSIFFFVLFVSQIKKMLTIIEARRITQAPIAKLPRTIGDKIMFDPLLCGIRGGSIRFKRRAFVWPKVILSSVWCMNLMK